jgi:sugar/nucleoside kinase (ribokinase family)
LPGSGEGQAVGTTAPGSTNGRLVCIGLTTLDLLQLAESAPQFGHKATAIDSRFDVGGPAANAAITAGALGADVTLITVLGSGLLPDFARAILAAHRVAVIDCQPGATLPVAGVWVDAGTGERTILAENNAELDVECRGGPWLPPDTAAILLDGHYAELAVAGAAAAADGAIPLVIDCGRWRPVYADLLPVAADVIMCSDFRPPGMSGDRADEIVAAVASGWDIGMCAMTRGPAPILVADSDGLGSIPVPEVDVVDTTGAGDVLHGAYLFYRFVAHRAARAALSAAAELASSSCRFLGAREAVDSATGP